jgi:carbonic anhydrase
MPNYSELLLQNRVWAASMIAEDPQFFSRLAQLQTPEYLWIGCSDSRVPANQITGTMPGEVFVHRNVANLVVATDFNLLAVLQYSVEVLKVKHIILCGHYGCGGVRAAMRNDNLGIVSQWLCGIKDVYHRHAEELSSIADESAREDRLVELNVMSQVENLAKTTVIQEAWSRGEQPELHGWVYGLKDGRIRELISADAKASFHPIYELSAQA